VKSYVAITGLKPVVFPHENPQNLGAAKRSWSRCTAFRDRSSRLLRSIFTLGISPKFRSLVDWRLIEFNDEKNLKEFVQLKPFYIFYGA
jgi:hypothetical protein